MPESSEPTGRLELPTPSLRVSNEGVSQDIERHADSPHRELGQAIEADGDTSENPALPRGMYPPGTHDGKRCTRCGEIGPVDQFGRAPRGKDGRKTWCKPCHVANSRAWREANPEKAAARAHATYMVPSRGARRQRAQVARGEP